MSNPEANGVFCAYCGCALPASSRQSHEFAQDGRDYYYVFHKAKRAVYFKAGEKYQCKSCLETHGLQILKNGIRAVCDANHIHY